MQARKPSSQISPQTRTKIATWAQPHPQYRDNKSLCGIIRIIELMDMDSKDFEHLKQATHWLVF